MLEAIGTRLGKETRMLVLSRRPNEKIVLPTLGIAIEVCSIKKNAVRIGIEAPPAIPIMRSEIAAKADGPDVSACKPEGHWMRNRLHTASLAVHLARKQLQAAMGEKASETLTEALQELDALNQEIASERINESKSNREIRALLVEDNCNESALLAEFLRMHRIKVETACDGQEALDYLQSHDRPDVILLDMRMPRCDGPTTIAALRRNTAYDGLKVFAVSGADPHEWGVETGSRGVDRWFTKPINPARLVQEMNQSLGLN